MDIFGDAFEYLLEQFADETKKSGGNFFTPKEIVRLLINLVKPVFFDSSFCYLIRYIFFISKIN